MATKMQRDRIWQMPNSGDGEVDACSGDTPEMLSRFLDNDLRGIEAARFAAHLNGCVACRGRFEAMRAQRALLHALPTPIGAAASRTRVLARFEVGVASGRPHPIPARPVSFWRFAPAPAAIGVAALVGVCFVVAGHGRRLAHPDSVPLAKTTAPQTGVALPEIDTLSNLYALHDTRSKELSAQDAALSRTNGESATHRHSEKSVKPRTPSSGSLLGGNPASATAARDPLNPDDIPEAL